MPRLLKDLYTQTVFRRQKQTSQYLECFENSNMIAFFNSDSNSPEDKYLYLSIIAAQYSWSQIHISQFINSNKYVQDMTKMPSCFTGDVKRVIQALVEESNEMNLENLHELSSYNPSDLASYICNLPAPLNLKCITDILNADLSDCNDKWGYFISCTISDNPLLQSRANFFKQLRQDLIKKNYAFYTDAMATNEDSTDTESYSRSRKSPYADFKIAPEFIVALKYPVYIDELSHIFCLLKAQSTAQHMPEETNKWQQQYLGFIADNNPKEIIRQFVSAMPEGSRKDF